MSTKVTKVKIKWDDIEARRAADEGVSDGLDQAAREILMASNQIVPFLEGELMGSGTIDFDLKAGKATVYYDAPYAVKLHEDRHLKIRGGRSVQYLRKATISSKPHVLQYFGDALKLRFRGGKAKPPVVPNA